MEPPVSLPMEKEQRSAATAAAEPPLDPPGTQAKFQGFLVVLIALFSVEEPMANSSMLTFPRNTASAPASRRTMVPSKGLRYPASILEAQEVKPSWVHMTSFKETGTPARGPKASPRPRLASTASAWASAVSSHTCV